MLPPLVGVAVNVTLVPAQIVPDGEEVILTEAVTRGFTVIVMGADVAGEPVAQLKLEVMDTVITSPLLRVEDV